MQLSSPKLVANMGPFLLGSTAPDLRAMTNGTRAEYHFASLNFKKWGTGVEGLLKSNPHLRASPDGHGPTQAFVAGYITHILLDELWIINMYRPYFGNRGIFADKDLGNIMDRALQLELDRISQETVKKIFPELKEIPTHLHIGFIPFNIIESWHKFVIEMIVRDFSWDRLRFMANRIASKDENHPTHKLANDFINNMPDSLSHLYRSLGPNIIIEFKQNAINRISNAIRKYAQ